MTKVIFLSFEIVLQVLAILLFVITVKISYETKKRNAQLTQPDLRLSINELNDSYEIETSYNQTVYKSTLRLSITALVYVLSLLPVIIRKIIEIYNGPIEEDYIREWFNVWDNIVGVFIGTLDIIVYGFLSPVFKSELKNEGKRILSLTAGLRKTPIFVRSPTRVVSEQNSDLGRETNYEKTPPALILK